LVQIFSLEPCSQTCPSLNDEISGKIEKRRKCVNLQGQIDDQSVKTRKISYEHHSMKNWSKLGFEANTPKVVNDNLTMEGAMLIWQGTTALEKVLPEAVSIYIWGHPKLTYQTAVPVQDYQELILSTTERKTLKHCPTK
jgi:hypothetical protein